MSIERNEDGYTVIAATGVVLARFRGVGAKRRALNFMRGR